MNASQDALYSYQTGREPLPSRSGKASNPMQMARKGRGVLRRLMSSNARTKPMPKITAEYRAIWNGKRWVLWRGYTSQLDGRFIQTNRDGDATDLARLLSYAVKFVPLVIVAA